MEVAGYKERRRLAAAAAGRPVRVTKGAAVTLTVAPGSVRSYTDVMQRAMDGFQLPDVGITDLRYRKA